MRLRTCINKCIPFRCVNARTVRQGVKASMVSVISDYLSCPKAIATELEWD